MLKEAMVAEFEALVRNFPRETDGNYENFGQDLLTEI
jgi:hypothetical protein